MIKPILAGRKTHTRRPVRPQPAENTGCPYHVKRGNVLVAREQPYGKVGDILWVKERYGLQLRTRYGGTGYFRVYKADYANDLHHEGYPQTSKNSKVKWELASSMPREYARLFLKVKSVRIERLQDISEEDAKKEGVFMSGGLWRGAIGDNGCSGGYGYCENAFKSIWQTIYSKTKYRWINNPFVWVYEFERVEV